MPSMFPAKAAKQGRPIGGSSYSPEQKVKFHQGPVGSAMGGSLMDVGEASLSDISADLIHDKLATWITNSFGREPSTLSSA
jgi:hypothetical protein